MADASRKLAERSEVLVENAARFQVLQTTMEQNRETISSLGIERDSVKVELAKPSDPVQILGFEKVPNVNVGPAFILIVF